jgi:PilZ domain-containing protein
MVPKWLRPGQVEAAVSSDVAEDPRAQRVAPRFDVDHSVSLNRPGLVPAAGLVFNISRSGAAIRFHGIHAPLPGPWPARLKHGDEIWISGLLEVAVPCWVVDVREGVLRVHFSLDPAMLRELRAKITTLIRP